VNFVSNLIQLLIARPDYWPFAFWVPIFLGLWMLARLSDRHVWPNRAQWVWLAVGGLTLAAFACFWAIHLFSPVYLGPIQPQIAEVSWYFAEGKPVYHGPAAGEVYNMLYGPYLYIITGWFEKFLGPSDFSYKLPGALAVAGALAMLVVHLRARVGMIRAVLGAGLFTALILALNPEELFSRADVFIVLAVVVGCRAAFSQSKFAPIVLGAALGFSLNLKIHAPIYFLPLLWVAWQTGYRQKSWLAMGVAAMVVAAAPFLLFSNVSLANYFWTLRVASGQGINPLNYFRLLEMFFCLGAPIAAAVLLAYRQNPRATLAGLRSQKNFIVFLLLEFVLLLLPASKYGAGLHHLLPLAVLLIVLGAELYAAGVRPGWDGSLAAGAATAVIFSWLASCLGIGLVRSYQNAAYLQGRAAWAHSVEADLRQISARYGSRNILLMGGSDNANYDYAYFRPTLVYAGQPIGFDPCGLMEREFPGSPVPELPELSAALAKNHPDKKIIWVVPKDGAPFTLTSYFAQWKDNGYLPNPPVYSEKFRARFFALNTKFASTQYYDLYRE
jgi:hypothetical protein